MSTFSNDLIGDQALAYLQSNVDKVVMCDGAPASYADATTNFGVGGNRLGDVAVAPGDFTIGNGDVSGRKVTRAQKTGVAVAVAGTMDHEAWLDTVSGNLLIVKQTTNVEEGTAQGGGAATVTLRAAASGSDDAFNTLTIQIVAGIGVGQVRRISDYVGATKVATVSSAWATPPDPTSVYEIFGVPVSAGNVVTLTATDHEIGDATAD